jgi:hypothetical protein
MNLFFFTQMNMVWIPHGSGKLIRTAARSFLTKDRPLYRTDPARQRSPF